MRKDSAFSSVNHFHRAKVCLNSLLYLSEVQHEDYLERQIESFAKALSQAFQNMLGKNITRLEEFHTVLQQSGAGISRNELLDSPLWTPTQLDLFLDFIISHVESTKEIDHDWIDKADEVIFALNSKTSSISLQRLELIRTLNELKERHGLR